MRPLYESLVTDLDPWLSRDLYVPASKALLSRAGGRCERDGAVLEFDPASPDAHRCPACGSVHAGELHHRAWITHYQLWLAERAVHAALFHALSDSPRHRDFAVSVLMRYADLYATYPNRDNVLGPTRLFFSTYLESIWLLQICVAVDLLASVGEGSVVDQARDRIIAPSAELIAEYDEGMSNRQVWNNAALAAAALVMKDDARLERAVSGKSGLLAHLANALLPDGTWYEGENYHQFALRGLWYCVTMCDRRRVHVPPDLTERFQRAFAAPYLSALPDFTMPSRKDSQYKVSLRQWRIAELTELGFARRQDPVLGGALLRLYDGEGDAHPTGRSTSTADAERNWPASALTRADLGWRALLHALPELPRLPGTGLRSVHLERQGLAVFRRDGRVYVAFDYGQTGGGHGHPDRLNVLLSVGETRWLDDLGTGSYVDPSLHWYRSTLAHNAPLVNGTSQSMVPGRLLAYEERDAMGWAEAELLLDDDVRLTRTIVVAPGYVLDELRWDASDDVIVDLPWHLDADADIELGDATIAGGDRPEDGFAFLQAPRGARVAPSHDVRLTSAAGLTAILHADIDTQLFAARAPGQPSTETRRFYLMRARARAGTLRAVVAWSEAPTVRFDADRTIIAFPSGERHEHERVPDGWRVALFTRDARSSIELGGRRPPIADPGEVSAPRDSGAPPVPVRRQALGARWFSGLTTTERNGLLVRELGEENYRRSEESWANAGKPRATVAIGAAQQDLVVHVIARAGDARFAPEGAENALDNEHADTMAAGVQLYVRTADAHGGWTLIPEYPGSRVRVRPIAGYSMQPPPAASWRRIADGWEMRITVPMSPSETREYPVDLDVLVNETVEGRDRRRGQLVLSGAPGEFVYLRGDRHDPNHYLRVVIVE